MSTNNEYQQQMFLWRNKKLLRLLMSTHNIGFMEKQEIAETNLMSTHIMFSWRNNENIFLISPHIYSCETGDNWNDIVFCVESKK